MASTTDRTRWMAPTPELDADQRAADDRLATLLDRRGRPRRGARGVYLHGPPGRGKTMLMDRFLAAARTDRARRWHFHEFFAALHATAATAATIDDAVAALVGNARLVCFDEFHLHDIGDAMLAARLLDTLFARRIPLVLTSNYAPVDLLPNPLFHDRFLPAIARITAHMEVVRVAGPRDYRRPAGPRAGARADNSSGVVGAFVVGSPPPDTGAVEVRVGPRALTTHPAGQGVLDADFAVLCGAPLAPADYLALAARFERWVVRGVPRLRTVPSDHAMRLVTLVDVLYDAGRALTVYAEAPIDDLVAGVAAVAGLCDLGRTASRLYEISHPGGAGAG
ncbi:cell division protein ZapE [Nocardia farcinica]|uniref:cell division protein ZapE n=1 Tax=Nocardia farcinica TaxID=37329 RepID=UPI0024540EB5|nr:cell division protein ZapE [Nocardia farcinica]